MRPRSLSQLTADLAAVERQIGALELRRATATRETVRTAATERQRLVRLDLRARRLRYLLRRAAETAALERDEEV